MMYGFGGHGWGFGMGWGWIIGLIIIVAIIWFISKSANQSNTSGRSVSKSALDILNERYARGEIDKNEFEKMKKDISTNIKN